MGLGRVSLVSSLGQGKAIATSTNFCQAVGTRLEDKVVWWTPHQTTPSVLVSGLMELQRGWSGSSVTNGFGLLGLGFLGLRAQAVLDRLEDPLVRVWFVFFFVCVLGWLGLCLWSPIFASPFLGGCAGFGCLAALIGWVRLLFFFGCSVSALGPSQGLACLRLLLGGLFWFWLVG